MSAISLFDVIGTEFAIYLPVRMNGIIQIFLMKCPLNVSRWTRNALVVDQGSWSVLELSPYLYS